MKKQQDNSVAVLARTNRALLPVEQALAAQSISFYYVNRSGFFSQPEITGVLAYLGACLYPANYLISQMLRTDFHPTKFLPKTRLAARFKELKSDDDQVSFWNLMTKEPRTLVEPKNLEALQHFAQFVHSLSRYRDMAPDAALKQLFGALRVGDHYAEFESIDNDPVQNLESLLKMSAKYRSIKEFLDFTRRVTAASRSKKGIALGTIHSAKGLEWSSVYVVQCSEGILPHAKSTDLEEERAILFVGASRAERRLVITYSGKISPFLEPFGELWQQKNV